MSAVWVAQPVGLCLALVTKTQACPCAPSTLPRALPCSGPYPGGSCPGGTGLDLSSPDFP